MLIIKNKEILALTMLLSDVVTKNRKKILKDEHFIMIQKKSKRESCTKL